MPEEQRRDPNSPPPAGADLCACACASADAEEETGMIKCDEAVALFRSGFNCSQAILRAYGDEVGLAAHHALKLGSGFGAGMRRGATCGAVTGAIMALGLRCGFDDPSDGTGKAQIAD